jgi:hypothetical protein
MSSTAGAPVEATPLTGKPPLVRQLTTEDVKESAQKHKSTAGGASQGCFGLVGAIMCLSFYYGNDGDNAVCGARLPLWLKVNGFGSIAYALAGCVVGGVAAAIMRRGPEPDALLSVVLGICISLLSCLSCFLLVWFILGIVWFFDTCSAVGKNWDEVAKARGPLCANPCDEGIYIGMEIYLFFSLVIPLVICCCMCCCLGFIASRESAK